MTKTLEELDREVWATQIWLRELFVFVAGSSSEARALAGLVRERIQDMKNAPPPDSMSDAAFDHWALIMIPYLERVGNNIANVLEASADVADGKSGD
jgi:hypothetical protein